MRKAIYLFFKHLRDNYIWPTKPYKYNFTITAGDVRKSTSYGATSCPLFLAANRQIGKIDVVGISRIIGNDVTLGKVLPDYTLHNYSCDVIKLKEGQAWLPDWHIMRRLTFTKRK